MKLLCYGSSNIDTTRRSPNIEGALIGPNYLSPILDFPAYKLKSPISSSLIIKSLSIININSTKYSNNIL